MTEFVITKFRTEGFVMLQIDKLYRRHAIPDLLQQMGLRGVGVEVGVATGAYAEVILERWQCSKLIMVDSWAHREGHDFGWNFDNNKFQKMYEDCVKLMSRFGERAEFCRKWSLDAAASFPDQHFDFIFLDASHFYDDVVKDLEAWLPKLKPGGIFAGHDYVEDCPSIGVKRAVTEFAARHHFKVHVTEHFENDWPSWLIKPWRPQ
jgi:SAM-dependent methyltransferase